MNKQLMKNLELGVVLIYLVLVLASIYMLVTFYVCDSHKCKVFRMAERKGATGSKENLLSVLDDVGEDGVWPVPFLAASILTFLTLWFLGCEITVRNFALLFFVSFAVFYFIINFFIHHYIKPVTEYAADYIKNNSE